MIRFRWCSTRCKSQVCRVKSCGWEAAPPLDWACRPNSSDAPHVPEESGGALVYASPASLVHIGLTLPSSEHTEPRHHAVHKMPLRRSFLIVSLFQIDRNKSITCFQKYNESWSLESIAASYSGRDAVPCTLSHRFGRIRIGGGFLSLPAVISLNRRHAMMSLSSWRSSTGNMPTRKRTAN